LPAAQLPRMSGARWGASVLIGAYVALIAIAAIPEPRPPADPRSKSRLAAANVSGLARLLDSTQTSIASLQSLLFHDTAAVRPAVQAFTNTGIGGGQQWYMFSDPYVVDQYVRVDSYVASDGGGSTRRLFRQLLLPAHHEDRVRFVHDYRDKAILVLLERYFKAQAQRGDRRSPQELGQIFEPITRYSRKRIAPLLAAGEHVTRSEMWFGVAPIPPPGMPEDRAAIDARLAALAPYHDRPAEVLPTDAGAEMDGDVRWTLLYVDPTLAAVERRP